MNKIRGEQSPDRQWWLDQRGEAIDLICSNDSKGWVVATITHDGYLRLRGSIGEDSMLPKLRLDPEGAVCTLMNGEESQE